jgi:hypothetical protein
MGWLWWVDGAANPGAATRRPAAVSGLAGLRRWAALMAVEGPRRRSVVSGTMGQGRACFAAWACWIY